MGVGKLVNLKKRGSGMDGRRQAVPNAWLV
jgi:hypothetical protein